MATPPPPDRAHAARSPHTRAQDVWGGLAAALVALPSSIAFGVVAYGPLGPAHAAAGALAGMVGAAVVGVIAPVVSRNGGFISAPCAPAAAVLSAVALDLSQVRALEPGRVLALLTVLSALSALLQVLYGALRAGRLIKFIPYQVVSGYLSGVALIIASAQVPRLVGAPAGTSAFEALADPGAWRWPGAVAGVVTIAAMALTPRFTTRVPGAIVGLAAGVAAYLLAGFADATLWSTHGNALVIGPVQGAGALWSDAAARIGGLGEIGAKDLALVIGPALTLSVLLSIDTLKTGIVLDATTQTRSDSNRELVGQGVANAASCVLGGMPGAATAGPTLVNLSSGGRTALSGVLEGAFVLLAFVLLGPLVAWVPIGALAGILLVVAFRMFDAKMFVLLARRSTRLDFFVIAAVVVVAETVGLIEASAVGVLLAILLFLRDQVRTSVVWRKTDLRVTRSKRVRTPEEGEILQQRGADAVVAALRGNLFFGTTDQLFSELEEELKHARFLLLDLRRVGGIDFSAANLLKQMRARLAERGGDLLLAGMPSAALAGRRIGRYLESLGLTGEDGVRVFDTRDSALEWMEQELLATWGYAPPEQRALALEELPLFRALDADALAQLRGSVRALALEAGAAVFRAGDAGGEVFFVRRGRVHALLPLPGGVRHHVATFGQGELFGEVGFLDRVARTADAEAAVPTELFALARDRFDALAAAHPAVGRRVFEELALALAQRLRTADAELRALEER